MRHPPALRMGALMRVIASRTAGISCHQLPAAHEELSGFRRRSPASREPLGQRV